MSQYLVTPSVALDEAGLDYPVFQYHSNPNNVSPNVPVIERTHNVLTRSEALENVEACRAAMLKGIESLDQAQRMAPNVTFQQPQSFKI